ncbi:MAG: HAMP domain-containing histidine kinase [Lachnospiraceae bacterium]|nr:HAMP domain-containing histidine kinase [Lachnospiraceae bacterium]
MREVRRKFVLYAMLAVFILLLLILSIINVTNFTMAAADADAITAMLAENKGRFSEKKNEAPDFAQETPQMPGSAGGTAPGDFSTLPFSPNGFGPMGPDSPETGFSLRYFTVRFGKDGDAKLTVYQIAAVSEEEALAWAQSLKSESKKNDVTGWTHGTYRYRCYTRGDSVFVTVIDEGRELTPSYRILIISLIGMVFGLLISFLFLTYISKRLFKPLEDADRKQRQFILEAEKEFKIPLTVIRADTELIERENGPSDYTSSIHRQVSRMADLNRNLGNLALFNESAPSENCSLSTVFETAASEAASALETAGIRLTAEWTEGITINANPEALKRIADELLDNIGKFAVSDALIRSEKHEGRIILTVSNDCTLPDGSCDNVFDRFIRLANAEDRPGAGLGLSFVKDAVRQIGGRVSAKVEDGRFILQLFL